ncbi:MAG: DUF5671 domain-containing protein [Patescibacteria group bacterium]
MDQQPQKSYLKEFFLYSLAVGTLYFSVGNLIYLFFEYINKVAPDVLNGGYFGSNDSGIRFAMATLIILFPVYIATSWFLKKDLIANPEKRDIRVRKFFVYLTLFLSSVAMIIDLVTLVYNFFEGELTLNFFLKIFVVMLVMGAVFAYYFWDLRHELTAQSKPSKVLGWSAMSFVVVSVLVGFFIIGSPFTQRMRRVDEMRIQHLSMLQDNIIYSYWVPKAKLPASSEDVRQVTGWQNDPETNQPYAYRLLSNLSFELCADFSLASGKDDYKGSATNDNWNHRAGKMCFKRTIDPEIHRPQKEMVAPGFPVTMP